MTRSELWASLRGSTRSADGANAAFEEALQGLLDEGRVLRDRRQTGAGSYTKDRYFLP